MRKNNTYKSALAFTIIFLIGSSFIHSYMYFSDNGIDCIKLEESWKAYIHEPNPVNAAALLRILPPQCFSDLDEDTIPCSRLIETVDADAEAFFKLVAEGKPDALKILFRITNISDIGYDFPYELLEDVIKNSPRLFLIELKNDIWEESKGNVEFITYFDLDTTGVVDAEIAEARERIDALKTVTDPALIKTRDICIKRLEKEITDFPKRGYIPQNLEECFDSLNEIYSEKDLLRIKSNAHAVGATFHIGLGMWIRNNWGLWSGRTKLGQYFRDIGVHHADDMSGIIFDSFQRRLQGKPIRLEEQVKECQEYWKKWLDPTERSPIDGAKINWWLTKGGNDGQNVTHLGFSTTDGTGWRYEKGSEQGIEPATEEENRELDETRKEYFKLKKKKKN